MQNFHVRKSTGRTGQEIAKALEKMLNNPDPNYCDSKAMNDMEKALSTITKQEK